MEDTAKITCAQRGHVVWDFQSGDLAPLFGTHGLVNFSTIFRGSHCVWDDKKPLGFQTKTMQ